MKSFGKTNFWKTVEKSFEDNTHEAFVTHVFLLVINIFLFIIAVLDLIYYKAHPFESHVHSIELFFGIIFLAEFILRIFYIYVPNNIFGGPYVIVNLIVIASLVTPQLFGNLAILRIVRSLKIVKIFFLEQETVQIHKNELDQEKQRE